MRKPRGPTVVPSASLALDHAKKQGSRVRGGGKCGSDFARFPPAPPVGSGYRVAAARGRADPNAAGPGRRRAGCGGVAGRAPGPARPPLTWSAQVGPGRGAGLARRRGIRPRPCRRRRRELTWETRRGRGASAAASPGNEGGPAGRQEAAAAEELNRTAHASPSHPSRPRRHLHLAPGRRAAPPAGHRFPPPALPTCQVSLFKETFLPANLCYKV